MASAWGSSWGTSWGGSWGILESEPITVDIAENLSTNLTDAVQGVGTLCFGISENVSTALRDDVWPDILSEPFDEEGAEGGVFPGPIFPGPVFPPPVFPGPGFPSEPPTVVAIGDHRHVMAGPIRQSFNADLYILGSSYVAAEK